jgi:hypothetical protein
VGLLVSIFAPLGDLVETYIQHSINLCIKEKRAGQAFTQERPAPPVKQIYRRPIEKIKLIGY